MWVMQQVLFASFDTRLATFLLDEVSQRALRASSSRTMKSLATWAAPARW